MNLAHDSYGFSSILFLVQTEDLAHRLHLSEMNLVPNDGRLSKRQTQIQHSQSH